MVRAEANDECLKQIPKDIGRAFHCCQERYQTCRTPPNSFFSLSQHQDKATSIPAGTGQSSHRFERERPRPDAIQANEHDVELADAIERQQWLFRRTKSLLSDGHQHRRPRRIVAVGVPSAAIEEEASKQKRLFIIGIVNGLAIFLC